jgi:flavin-binding protein dodecin
VGEAEGFEGIGRNSPVFTPWPAGGWWPQDCGLMKDPVYKLIELTGTSATSVEDAVGGAIKRASKTVKNLRWFQVVETRGTIEKGKVLQWQVTLKVGFAVEG